jgi:hypothetical protein
MLPDLRGDDFLLEPRQQSLRLVQPQTQIGDIAEIIRSVDFHDVQGPPFAFGADLHQPQNPGHALPRVKSRAPKYLVARAPQNLRQSPRIPSA